MLIKSIGQITDSQTPALITAITSLGTVLAQPDKPLSGEVTEAGWNPTANIYPIIQGISIEDI